MDDTANISTGSRARDGSRSTQGIWKFCIPNGEQTFDSDGVKQSVHEEQQCMTLEEKSIKERRKK